MPAEVLKLRGSWRAGERERREAKFRQADVRCPRYLSKDAKALWKRIAPKLKAAKILSAADVTALEVLCELHADFRHARAMMAREGMTAVSDSGWISKNAWRQIADRAARDLLVYLSAFGMTPSSRSGVARLDDLMAEATGLISRDRGEQKYF